jgi:hypothetical protein
MIHFARPRDTDESRRRANERTLETYKHEGPWCVECFNSRGVWQWTHFGEKPMSKANAKRMAKLCQRIQDDLDRGAKKPGPISVLPPVSKEAEKAYRRKPSLP